VPWTGGSGGRLAFGAFTDGRVDEQLPVCDASDLFAVGDLRRIDSHAQLGLMEFGHWP
jgi:hypothetical protein